MSYSVDSKTLLFTDLSMSESKELTAFVSRIVLEGFIDMQHPAFLAWTEAGKFDDRSTRRRFPSAPFCRS